MDQSPGHGEVALVSVHPDWAEAIVDGRKTVELRRQAPKRPLDYVVVYSTSPVKRVVGWAPVREVVVGSPASIWRTWGKSSGVPRATFRAYFSGTGTGYAIVLGPAVRLEEPMPLESLGLVRPPQSFQYLNGNADAVPGLAADIDAAHRFTPV